MLVLVQCCVVIGSVRYQHWLLNNDPSDTGEIDRDAGLITSLHSARMLLTINITITYSGPAQCSSLLSHYGAGTRHWTVVDIVIYLLRIEDCVDIIIIKTII